MKILLKLSKIEAMLLVLTFLFFGCVSASYISTAISQEKSDYTISDQKQVENGQESAAPLAAEVVNINTADAKALALLPGIGEELAKRIVDYRDANGAFGSIEDIMKVKGIGQSKYEDMQAMIAVK